MHSDLIPDPPTDLSNYLLLASPMLMGSIFEKSCILITEKNDSGYEGFIINQRTDQTVGDLLAKTKGSQVGDLPVHFGGPVQADTLHFLKLKKNGPHLSFTANISLRDASESINQEGTIILPCIGLSGWTKGQLEDEFDHFTWFFKRAGSNLTKAPLNIQLWKNLLSSISPYHKLIANAPATPLRN